MRFSAPLIQQGKLGNFSIIILKNSSSPVTSLAFIAAVKNTSSVTVAWATFAANGTITFDSIPVANVGSSITLVGTVTINSSTNRTFEFVVEVLSPAPIISTNTSNQGYIAGRVQM